MEGECSWEYTILIDELTQGMEQAQQLGAHLSLLSSSSESRDLLRKIVSSYEKALGILKWRGSVGESQSTATALVSGVLESSLSVNGSPRSEEFGKAIKDHQDYANAYKKRKTLPTWTDQVRVSPDNGLEGPREDGYSWRKYGQKDILGATYPRSYYRCTYRQMKNCWATKQVQRSDEDPSVFEITYKGTHTCQMAPKSAPAQPSPEKKELKRSYNDQLLQPNQTLMNLRANLRVKTDHLVASHEAFPLAFPPTFGDSQEYTLPVLGDDSFLGTYTPSFVSPATPESNYFSSPSRQMNGISEPADIFSANTSSTNSPIMGMEFPIDHVDIDPNFPFDTPGFFTLSC